MGNLPQTIIEKINLLEKELEKYPEDKILNIRMNALLVAYFKNTGQEYKKKVSILDQNPQL